MESASAALLRELRQRRPFRSRAEELVVALARTADLVRRVIEPVVAGRDITTQQYNVLRILRGAGAEGLPTLEIGERMVEQSPGVTRLVDRLEAKGLVRRERGAEDRRQVRCRITSRGLELVRSLDGPVADAARAAVAGLGAAERARLLALLDALRARHR